MKMHWFDRILLTLVLLVMIFIGLYAIGLAVGGFEGYFMGFYEMMMGLTVNRIILGLTALLLVAFSLRLLFAGARRHGGPPMPQTVLLKSSEHGEIRMAVTAVDAMVQRAARANASIRDVASRVLVTEHEAVAIQLRLILAPDVVAPEVAQQLQDAVRDYIQQHAGLPVQEVQVFIEQVGGSSAQMARVE